MKSVLCDIIIQDYSNFTMLELSSKFQLFYEELYYNSEFLQTFFDEPYISLL